MTTLELILGLALLFVGGEFLVRGSVALALRLKISTLVVGMTVVASATSSPELFVSLQAALQGESDIALGNVVGSNIANITFILGLTAIIFSVKMSEQTYKFDFPILFIVSTILGLVLYFFEGLNLTIGILFLLALIIQVWFLISVSRKEHLKPAIEEDEVLEQATHDNIFKSLALLILGILMLKFGADYLIKSAVDIARKYDISERIIAVTIVAVGTSIPELVTSIIGAMKKENDLVVGNLIGSNIFNILCILGLVAIIKPIQMTDTKLFSFDFWWMIIAAISLGLVIYVFTKRIISKREGFFLLLVYCAYMYFLLK